MPRSSFAPAPAPNDNRRLITRIVTREILEALAALARMHGGDMFEMLVFAAIWTANSGHLTSTDRYAGLYDIPPDRDRRPMSDAELAAAIGAPAEILEHYLDKLIADGIVERVAGGLTVPAAVFTRADMLDGSGEIQARMAHLIVALRRAGFEADAA